MIIDNGSKTAPRIEPKENFEINHTIIEEKIRLNIMIKQNKNDTGFREGGRTVGSGRVATIIE